MAKKIKSNTAGTGRIISPEDKALSDILTTYAKKFTGDESVYAEYRDLSTHGKKAMVRKKKFIIGKEENINDAIRTFVSAVAVRNVLYSVEIPEMFSSHGVDIWNEHANNSMWTQYNNIRKDVISEMHDSPWYKSWQISLTPWKKAGKTEDGAMVFHENDRPDVNSIISQSIKIEKVVEKEIEKRVSSRRNSDVSKAPLLHKLDRNIYASSFIPLDDKIKQSISHEISRIDKETLLITSLTKELAEAENIKTAPVHEEFKQNRNSLSDSYTNSEEEDRNFLIQTLFDVAVLQDINVLELEEKRKKAQSENKLDDFVQYMVDLVCDKPGERFPMKEQPEFTPVHKKEKKKKEESAVLVFKNGTVLKT